MTGVDHYIKPLTQTQMPRQWVTMAAASMLGGDRTGYTQSWRRASIFGHYRHDGQPLRTERDSFDDCRAMWAHLHKRVNISSMTFLWVHDLQWTARVTDLIGNLTELGWTLDAFALNPSSSWMVWRRKRATLKIADVMSIWPVGIPTLGSWFGLGAKDIPSTGAHWQAWDAWLTRNRDILALAVLSYMDWVGENELGTLAVTGNAQCWKAFRRRFLTTGVVVHHDESLRAMERRAMWTGRCEAYWRGSLLRESVDEWDFTMAHNEIAMHEAIPVFPDRPISPQESLVELLDRPGCAVLADVRVRTETPCLPTQMGEHIAWPTGTFRGVYWSPELRIALESGADLQLRQGWLYRADPLLQRWAQWIGAHIAADDLTVPVWQKDLLKRWSNTVIGRFGMRYPKWVKVGRSRHSTISAAALADGEGSDLGSIVQIGHDLWEQAGWAEPHDAAPMVTGYIMSAMRAKLWRLMQAVPDDVLLYVDTDSLLVPDGARGLMSALSMDPEFRGLRLKRSWDGLSIYGPRQLVTGDSVRVAGLPRAAKRLGRREFEGEVTEGLLEALRIGQTDVVRVTPRQWRIMGEDVRRAGDGFGWTHPFKVNDF